MTQRTEKTGTSANFLHNKLEAFSKEIKTTVFERIIERIDPEKVLRYVTNEGAPKYRATQFSAHIVALSEGCLRAYNKVIYTFEGTHWQQQEYSAVMAFLRMAREKAGLHTDRKSGCADFLKACHEELSLLERPPRKRERPAINLLNGTLEIYPDGVELRPHDKEDFFTYVIPYEYIEGARAYEFERFLEEVVPEHEARAVLQEYAGLVLLPHGVYGLNPEKVLLLYGTGANGKSVFHNIITEMVGKENVTHYTLSEITDEKGYNRAAMEGKLLNYSSEVGGKYLEADVFKRMVSGEPVSARLLYRPPFTLTNYPRFIFNCNRLPSVEHTHAFFRRFIIVPFEKTIPVEKQDQELSKRITQTELPGVLNWALEGLFRLIENSGRFTRSLLIEKAIAQFKRDSSSVALWFEEEGQELLSQAEKHLFKDVYNAYKMYCIEAGLKAISRQAFSHEMKTLANVYHGAKNKVYVSLHT